VLICESIIKVKRVLTFTKKALSNFGVKFPDVIVGGPPCEPFSKANRRRMGEAHSKYYTLEYFAHFAVELKPRYFILENVCSVRNHNIFNNTISLLERAKYEVEVAVLNAAEYGVPQRRRRLLVFGALDESPSPLINTLKRLRSKERVTVSDAISDLPKIENGCSSSVMDYDKPPLTKYQMWVRKGAEKLYNHVTMNLRRGLNKIKYISPGENLVKAISRMPEEIRRKFRNPRNIHKNMYRRLSWSEVAPTIVNPSKALLIHPEEDRVISVREAARLQSFPDTYVFYGGVTSQYKQVADATPPLLAVAIGRALLIAFQEDAG